MTTRQQERRAIEKRRTLDRKQARDLKQDSVLWAARRIGESQAEYQRRLNERVAS